MQQQEKDAADQTPRRAVTGTTSPSPSLGSFNQKNPAIRRILADARELARDPSDQYAARCDEDNMFEWHFAIRGPLGSEFEGGRYHGKILLPSEYPFKPPNIVFLTPNGRWETKTKICLSMSSFHPEEWQPAWGIRTMLEALISFMPSPGDGALGALDASAEVRARLAKESLLYAHAQMPQLPELGSCRYVKGKDVAEALSMLSMKKAKDEGEASSTTTTMDEQVQHAPPVVVEQQEVRSEKVVVDNNDNEEEAAAAAAAEPATATAAQAVVVAAVPPRDSVDELLKATSWGILFALFCFVYRKLLVAYAPEV